MAAITTNIPSDQKAANSNAFIEALRGLHRWNETRKTFFALGRLTNRELDDIGINRGDIYAIASGSMKYRG